ncbi:hypothetical protein C8Q80DRAFT_948709 [Daedaleopsis nitida]|nr:hypothetical protein C8Q80DRAFT_948709 [Daedaleopsis nitida]
MPADAPAPLIRRDDEFWFEDGTVTLVARDVEFRVYKGLLASRSPVFRDMFSLPQPTTSSDIPSTPVSLDVPRVHLTDSPDTFRELLRILTPDVNSHSAHLPGTFEISHPSCFTIASCTRLGHKYQMDGVVEHCLRYLRKYFPTSYDEFEELSHFVPPAFDHSDAICVINLARLVGDTSLLPTAVIACCVNFNAEELIDGFLWSDGSREILSRQDLLCLTAKERLARECVERVRYRFWAGLPAERCQQAYCVNSQPHTLLQEAMMYTMSSVISGHPFSAMGRAGFCDACTQVVDVRDREVMLRIWQDLPTTTGVGPIPGWGGEP